MKQTLIRIVAFSVSICIVVLSILLCPASVYASEHGGGGTSDKDHDGATNAVGKLEWDEMSDFRKWVTIFEFVTAQTNAVVDGEFTTYLQNQSDFKEYVYGKTPDDIVTVTDKGITIPADLVAIIKQALIEYAEETNPFYIMNTIRAKSVLASTFACKEMYQEFIDYTSSHRITAFDSSGNVSRGSMFLGDVTPIIKGGGGFILHSGNPKKDNYIQAYTLNGDWLKEIAEYDRYDYTFADGAYSVNMSEKYGVFNRYMFYLNNYPPIFTSIPLGNIVTEDGGRIRVFKSQSDFMEYSVGQRKVYFGSGFYDFDPTDITATWDDISGTLDHMDDILQELLDKINDSTDESAIEELLQEILDAIRNGGGGGNGGGDESGVVVSVDKIEALLQEILDAIMVIGGNGGGGIGGTVSQWYQDILDYLDKILKQLKSIKRWTVIDTFIDGVDAIADWLDLIHDVLSDVDDGAESAIATLSDALDDATGLLKSKFPFSVPWDIFFFVTLLAADPETPHFEVPIDFDVSAIDMHIHYDFVVDFSDYKYLSDICRVVLSMTYAVGLMKMTAGIVNTKKEE